MAKASPLQQVKASFGGKEQLVDAIVSLGLEHREGEDAQAFRQRLLTVSNGKLLRLHARQSRLKSDFGGKESLVDAIVGMKFTKPNNDYKVKLMSQQITRLLDLHDSLKKKQD